MKKLDKLIKIVSILLLSLLICLGINDIYSQQKIFSEFINHLESDIKKEYKTRLKDMVNTTISFVKTTQKDIEEEYFLSLTVESQRIENATLTKEFPKNYQHDFIILSKNSGKNRLSKKIIINNQVFFLSVKNSKISKELENKIRGILYQNTKDNGQYIWINKVLDYDGGDNYATRLIHPNLKATEGIYLSTNTKDIGGNSPYLEELIGINKKQEVFFEYFFKTMNTNKVSKKLSFAKLYSKENWIIVFCILI